jgi:beta-lactamase regulating signal transducer with metallopeptidase domain
VQSPSPHRSDRPGETLLLGVWLLGAAWKAVRLARGALVVRRLRERARPVVSGKADAILQRVARDLRLHRPPVLCESAAGEGPLLLAGRPPVVLCPPWLLEPEQEQRLRLVLAHELAHLQRHDLRWGWLTAVAQVVFFFHPLLWLAEREQALAQESACDAQALQLIDAPAARYAETLVRVATRGRFPLPNAVALGAVGSRSLLKRRLLAMQFISASSRPLRRDSRLALLALAALVVLPWRFVPQSPAAAATPEGSAPKPDSPEVTALLARARKALQAPGLRAEYEFRFASGTTVRWRVAFLKPAYGRMELVPEEGQPGQTILSNGKELIHLLPATKEYGKNPEPRGARAMTACPLLIAFLNGSSPIVGAETSYAGKQTIDGTPYDVVEYSFGAGTGGGRFFLAADGTPTGFEQWGPKRDAASTTTEWLRKVELGARLTPQQFSFDPRPEGYHRIQLKNTPEQP